MSPAALMRAVGQAGEISTEDVKPVRHSLGTLLSVLPTFLRLALQRLALPVLLWRHFAKLRRSRQELAATDPTGLADAEIWGRMQAFNRLGPRFIVRTQAIVGVLSVEILRPLEFVCDRVRFSASRLLDSSLAVGKRTVSGQQAFELLELAHLARNDERARSYFVAHTDGFGDLRVELKETEFLLRFDEFLNRYGHRAPYESDLSIPRSREDPTPILAAIRSHVRGAPRPTPAEIEAKQRGEAIAVWREFVRAVPRWQRPVLVGLVRFLLRRAKKAYAWRELNRFELTRVGEHIRKSILALGDRFVSHGWIDAASDIFFLPPDEVEAAIADPAQGPDLSRRIAERKRRQRELAALEVPLVIDGRSTETVTTQPADAGSAKELRGQCISSGLAEGEVVVIHEPTQFSQMKPGAILVAPATDPAWTPLFIQAAGIIVEVGGQISHAAIVAREFGLPALANVRNATRLLVDGDVVRLDATNEIVEILRRR
jgi:pyruvate,water dikinase